MIPSAPKFRKVILLLKDKFSKDIDVPSSIKGKIYELKEIDSYKLYKD